MSDSRLSAALTVDDLTLAFGGLFALSAVSVHVAGGSVLGIVGPNGSGKTSMLNCISGVYRPTKGSILVGNESIGGLRPDEIARLGVGRTFQHVEVPGDLTVGELALLGRHTLLGRAGILSYGLGLPFLRNREAVHRMAAENALSVVGLADMADEYIADLPYGLAKRADIARALAGKPKLLLLDEPAAGLNESERMSLSKVIMELPRTEMTILLIEHDMSFVSRVCDRVLVLVQGERVYEGNVADALRDDQVVEALMGKVANTAKRAQPTE